MMLEEFRDNCSREKALRESFSVAKYTGYLITKIAESFNVILVSSLDPKQLKNAGIQVVTNVQEALDAAGHIKLGSKSVYFMPNGANTLPRLI